MTYDEKGIANTHNMVCRTVPNLGYYKIPTDLCIQKVKLTSDSMLVGTLNVNTFYLYTSF